MMIYEYRMANLDDLEAIWDKNISDNAGDLRWRKWKEEYINYNKDNKAKTFIFLCDGLPMGEGTLLFSPECGAISGKVALADGVKVANINALRIDKAFEGNGHISKLVSCMETYALSKGVQTLTIGVGAKESRSLAIYLHWGYNKFIMSEVEDDDLVLYYLKTLQPNISTTKTAMV